MLLTGVAAVVDLDPYRTHYWRSSWSSSIPGTQMRRNLERNCFVSMFLRQGVRIYAQGSLLQYQVAGRFSTEDLPCLRVYLKCCICCGVPAQTWALIRVSY